MNLESNEEIIKMMYGDNPAVPKALLNDLTRKAREMDQEKASKSEQKRMSDIFRGRKPNE